MASYSAKVAGTVAKGDNLESADTVTETQFGNRLIEGEVINAPDTWLYEGFLLDLNVPSGFALEINGERVNPQAVLEYYATELVLTAGSEQNPVEYTFTTTGRIFPGPESESNDSITQNSDGTFTASGVTGGSGATADSFYVLGGFDKSRTSINGSNFTVTYDGSQVSPADLPDAGSVGPQPNSPPELGDFVLNGDVLSGTSATVSTEEEITVALTEVSDPDGNFAPPLEWVIRSGNTVLQMGTGPNISTTFSSGGSAEVLVTATDTEGASTQQILDLTVEEANAPPEIGEWRVNGEPVSEPLNLMAGEEFTVAVSSVSDPNQDFQGPLQWDMGDGTTGEGPSFTHAYSAGSYTLSVTAQDAHGATTTQSLNVEVQEQDTNAPPNLGDFVVNGQTPPSSIETGQQVTVALTSVSDPDGNFAGPLEWSANNGQSGTGPDFTTSWNSPGTATVTVTAYDAEGASTSDTLSMEVKQPDARPNASMQVSVNGNQVTLDASGSSDDFGITSYTWNVGSRTYNGQTVTDTFSDGDYTVSLTVRDASGQTDSTEQTFTVGDPGDGGGGGGDTPWGVILGAGAVAYLVSNRDN